MMRSSGRTEECGPGQARVRLSQARAFLDAADLIGLEEDELAGDNVVAALAVLAGIAGCRRGLRCHPRSPVEGAGSPPGDPGGGASRSNGKTLARALGRLLDIKDGAHYGMVFVNAAQAKAAIRNASTLVDSATKLMT